MPDENDLGATVNEALSSLTPVKAVVMTKALAEYYVAQQAAAEALLVALAPVGSPKVITALETYTRGLAHRAEVMRRSAAAVEALAGVAKAFGV